MVKRKILIHAHIFKNAGSTLDFSLKRSFGDRFIDHREDDKMVVGKQEYLEAFLKDHPEVVALSSHSIHFIPKDTPEFEFYTIYMLRHPIERIRSVYDFERKQEIDRPGPNKAKELDLARYVEWRMQDDVPATIRNCQTVFLSGEGPNADDLENKFLIASENIIKSLIGITHRYNESMVVFEEKLKPLFPDIDLSYRRKNVIDQNHEEDLETKLNSLRKRLGNKKLMRVVEEKNAFDLALFNQVKSSLSKKLNSLSNLGSRLENLNDRIEKLKPKKQG